MRANANPEHDPRWLSLRDAAIYVGASVDTIRRRINDGQLRAYYLGKSSLVRVKASDLDRLMKPVRTLGLGGE